MTEFRNFLTDFGNLLIVIRANEKLSVKDMTEKIDLEKITSSLINLALFLATDAYNSSILKVKIS